MPSFEYFLYKYTSIDYHRRDIAKSRLYICTHFLIFHVEIYSLMRATMNICTLLEVSGDPPEIRDLPEIRVEVSDLPEIRVEVSDLPEIRRSVTQ